MIKIKCYKCDKDLDELGALIFSHPLSDFPYVPEVHKYHICRRCFYKVMDFIQDTKKRND